MARPGQSQHCGTLCRPGQVSVNERELGPITPGLSVGCCVGSRPEPVLGPPKADPSAGTTAEIPPHPEGPVGALAKAGDVFFFPSPLAGEGGSR
jgi:hypothetical protein